MAAKEEPPRKRNRAAADDEAAETVPRPPEFSIKLDMKGKNGLGLDVDWGDGKTLFIKGVKAEGAVAEWNKTCAPHQVIKGGDRVIAINDKEENPKAMLSECRTKTVLNLIIRTGSVAPAQPDGAVPDGPKAPRPIEFSVKLDMNGKAGLGLDVDWSDGRTLYIKNVKPEGAVPDWNQGCSPKEVVQKGDRVVAINDKADDPKAMLAECRARKNLKLVIRTDMPALQQPAKAKEQAAVKVSVPVPAMQRPKCHEFTVLVDMTRQTTLGVDVDWSDGKTLYINSVQPGAIQDWNLVHPIYQQVSSGDRIVAVNGYADDPEAMANLCKELVSAQVQFHLLIRGPPPPPPPAPDKDRRDKEDKKEKRDRTRDRRERDGSSDEDGRSDRRSRRQGDDAD